MFVTQRQLDRALGYAEQERAALTQRYCDLLSKHERLLRHLGLYEKNVPAKTELRTKEGPERGDS